MEETWRPIGVINGVDFTGLYEISTLARVKTICKSTERIMKQGQRGDYKHLVLYKDFKYYCYSIHRLMALMFLDNPENKPQVNHKDGNKLNNKLENLEWATVSENTKHSFENGLQSTQGIKNANAKLTEFDVRYIRFLSRTANLTKTLIGDLYGMHRRSITDVITGKNWGHIV